MIRKRFATEAEARAFAAGVEYVNDASCRVELIEERPAPNGAFADEPWLVWLDDDDAGADSDGTPAEPL